MQSASREGGPSWYPGVMHSAAVMVIGNFDGVHTGHQAVMAEALAQARRENARLVAFTFDPHPQEVVAGRPVAKLCSLTRRIELLKRAGADEVFVQPFTAEFARTEPLDFARLLAERSATCVYVGENFRFGRERSGSGADLAAFGQRLGFQVCTTRLFGAADAPVSSSRIRQSLLAGDVNAASVMLGRPHRLAGVVHRGDGWGRGFGFPTANLAEYVELLPEHGVYAVVATLAGGRRLHGVLNVGVRPTVGGTSLRVEAHLLDAEIDLYDQPLAIDFVQRLRAEQRFASIDELKGQIARDVISARAAFAQIGTLSP